MKNLFKLEWRKVLKSKILYIFLVIVAVLPLLNELIVYFSYDIAKEEYHVSLKEFIEAAKLSGVNSMLGAISASDISLCMALFVSIYICTDYSDGTLRNVIGRGYKRLDVFTVKYIISMAVTLGYVIVAQIFSFIYGSAFWGAGTFKAKMLLMLFVQTVNMLALTSFYILFSVLVKKMGGAICSCLFIPVGITLVLSICDLFTKENAKVIPSYFWSGNVFSNLTDFYTPNITIIVMLVSGFVSLALFTGLSILCTRNTEY
ncbi:MAG: ABC transporter permease subunit [Clostridia bacterium]|nr:ABC transporter permease subunit [Clostridia bacterium]